jgi:hypothetical protein
MSARSSGETGRRSERRGLWLVLAIALVALLTLANAHLVYVAVGSQPACVPHAKSAGEAGMLRAARPVC